MAKIERSARGRHSPLAGEHLPRLSRFLKPVARVDGVACDERAPDARLADDYLAGVHTDAHCQIALEQLMQPALHPERCVQRSLCVILERRRRPEHRHDGVPRELLDRPAGSLDLLGHGFVEALEAQANPFGILVSRQRGRADEVGEENRDELPFLPDGHR